MLNSPWNGVVSTFAASWIALTMPLPGLAFRSNRMIANTISAKTTPAAALMSRARTRKNPPAALAPTAAAPAPAAGRSALVAVRSAGGGAVRSSPEFALVLRAIVSRLRWLLPAFGLGQHPHAGVR